MDGRRERGLYRDEACVSCGSVEARNVTIKREGSNLMRLQDGLRLLCKNHLAAQTAAWREVLGGWRDLELDHEGVSCQQVLRRVLLSIYFNFSSPRSPNFPDFFSFFFALQSV